jgi:hypothetical protein
MRMRMREVIIVFSILFFVMFFYSGITKIPTFDEKVKTLDKKLYYTLPEFLLKFGMICVIVLEIVGPIIIIRRLIEGENSSKSLILLSNFTFLCFVLFLMVVTVIYHPLSFDKPIPFLSNLTTLSGIVLMCVISNSIPNPSIKI